jgi:hypothetical protein
MRTLGIALLVAWLTVGLDLLMFPETQLEAEIAATKHMLPELKDSPLVEIPEFKKTIDSSERLIINPSVRRIVIWAEWSILFLLVMFGLWSAHAVFRRHSDAMTLMLTGALVFLGKEAIFSGGAYKRLFEGTNEISVSLENGYYQFAVSFAWYHRILPVFFLLVTVLSCMHFVRKRPGRSQAM